MFSSSGWAATYNTEDNVFTKDELKKIKFLEAWAVIGPLVGIGIGLLF